MNIVHRLVYIKVSGSRLFGFTYYALLLVCVKARASGPNACQRPSNVIHYNTSPGEQTAVARRLQGEVS